MLLHDSEQIPRLTELALFWEHFLAQKVLRRHYFLLRSSIGLRIERRTESKASFAEEHGSYKISKFSLLAFHFSKFSASCQKLNFKSIANVEKNVFHWINEEACDSKRSANITRIWLKSWCLVLWYKSPVGNELVINQHRSSSKWQAYQVLICFDVIMVLLLVLCLLARGLATPNPDCMDQ